MAQRSIDTLAPQKHLIDLSPNSEGDVGLTDEFELTMIFDDILLVEYVEKTTPVKFNAMVFSYPQMH
jgi:hypothetical protein